MKALVSLSLSAAAALVCSLASAQAPRTLEFAVQTTPAEPAARALTDFARNVERQTGGAVRIRLRFVAMNVASGALRAAAPVGAMLQREDVEALCPNVAAYRAPALFPDLAAADRVFQTMRPELESSCATGVTVLGWALPGPRDLYVRDGSLEVQQS
jgi:TRAP-type C4-dicarboxylate transport system substrate-binding protein